VDRLKFAAIIILTLISASTFQLHNENVIWLTIINQHDEPISSIVKVKVIGGMAELYNETHWIVKSSLNRILIKVYRYDICVGLFNVETDKNYKLKVSVSRMKIETLGNIALKVSLIGTKHYWMITGKTSYTLENMPHGIYEFEIEGTTFRKTIYFDGGTIRIKGEFKVDLKGMLKMLPIIIISTIALELYEAYRKMDSVKLKIKPRIFKINWKKKSKRKIKNLRKMRDKRPKSLAEALLKTET